MSDGAINEEQTVPRAPPEDILYRVKIARLRSTETLGVHCPRTSVEEHRQAERASSDYCSKLPICYLQCNTLRPIAAECANASRARGHFQRH
ncbi:hypothetical protein BST61_g592 [Cercospora zeina]